MEIRSTDLNRIQTKTEARKKPKKTTAHGFTNALDEQASPPIHQSSAVFSVDPMFADLEEPSAQQKGIQKGLSLLDELEKLRGELLGGGAAPNTIMDIQNYVKELNIDDLDDHLKGLLLEIETRAVVELAKFRMRGS
jgi:hypothetical protein